jgi:hypothetical protein
MHLSPADTTGQLTATTQIKTAPCRIMGFQLNAGSGTTTLTIYDSATAGTGASGMLDQHVLAANANSIDQWWGPQGLMCNNGIYATLSGSGASFILYSSIL